MQSNHVKRLHPTDSPIIQRTPKQRRLSKKSSNLWNESNDSIFENFLSQDYIDNELEEDCLNANICDFSDNETTICEEESECEKKDSTICEKEAEIISQHFIDLSEFNETFDIPTDFEEEEKPKDEFQGTEKFFDDIKVDFNESEFRDFQCSQMLEGTNYETREDIKQSQTFKIPPTPKGFSQICWETQVFEEQSKSSGLFVSKGPFYGLSEKVEKLVYSSKGIKSLYGKFLHC